MAVKNGKKLNLFVLGTITHLSSRFQIQNNANSVLIILSYYAIVSVGSICYETLLIILGVRTRHFSRLETGAFVKLNMSCIFLQGLRLTHSCLGILPYQIRNYILSVCYRWFYHKCLMKSFELCFLTKHIRLTSFGKLHFSSQNWYIFLLIIDL
jgi:hypothetical protein